ncbi:hypothetical protein, partial [Acinetobacter baumannii]|uniref:hypothetical protein n=1 Tax=Acinetobacter baumannii TaxID=470 RepID=UPI00398A2249
MVIRRNCGFFWVKKAYTLYGIAIFDHYLTNFIGKRYQTSSKKNRFVSKAGFCGIFELCKIIKFLKNNSFLQM